MIDLLSEWKQVSLMDVVDLHDSRRVPLNNAERASRKGPYPYYGANGQVDSIDDFLFDGDYVLLAEDGGYFDDPSRGVAYEVAGRFWVNNHAHILSPRPAIIRRFLTYVLNHQDWMPYVGGSTRLKLTQQSMRQVKIPLPPLAEQHRIVAKLDGLLGRSNIAREELSRIRKLVQRCKQAILAAACSGELTGEWRGLKKLAEPKLVLLGSVASDLSYGSSSKSNPTGKIPVLRMGNIQDGKLDWENLVYTSNPEEIEKYKLKSGDVLFNRTNSPELVGKTALYQGEREAIYAGYLIRIKCNTEVLPPYLVYCLCSPAGRAYCWDVKTDGVSQSNINAKKLAAFPFFLPSLVEQKEIVRRIEEAFEWLGNIASDASRARELLNRLEQAVLTKAFGGELFSQSPSEQGMPETVG